MERQSDANNQLSIVIDNARPTAAGDAWERGFEDAISRAATMAVDSVGRGLSVEVLCRGSRSPIAHGGTPVEPVLRFLALLEDVPEAEAGPVPPSFGRAAPIELPVVPRRQDA